MSASGSTPRETEDINPAKKGRARPPGLMCMSCAKRTLRAANRAELEVFRLKLRDWIGVEIVEWSPCLSRCPEAGITVERRGKRVVLERRQIDIVHAQFDPTRQLSFFPAPNPEDEFPS